MTPERLETEWRKRLGVECRLIAESKVAYRGESLSGCVAVRRSGAVSEAGQRPVKVEVELQYLGYPLWVFAGWNTTVAYRRMGELHLSEEERLLPFELPVEADSQAQPGVLVARVLSSRWPHRRLLRAEMPIRIGPDRTAEEVILDLAALAEAKIQSWNTRLANGAVRSRFVPLRSGARYRWLQLEIQVHQGRGRGTLHVLPADRGPAAAFHVDLRLSDRRECREAFWSCLSHYLDLSGQFPIPVSDGAHRGEHLPRPALPPSLLGAELPRPHED